MDNETSEAERREALQILATDYLQAWSTTDAGVRAKLVAGVYAEQAEFFSSEDGDLRLQGRQDIAANIAHVNERDIRGHGLAIEHRATSVNHRAVKVTWRMVTGDGCVALSGLNMLILDSQDRIAQDFIFIG